MRVGLSRQALDGHVQILLLNPFTSGNLPTRMAFSFRLALVSSAFVVVAWSTHAAPVTSAVPHVAPQDRPANYDAAAENQRCEACHLEIAAEWRRSLHHQSWDDPVFLRAYAIEPQAFCRACHVPEADPTTTPAESARRLGVGCVTCHAPAGEIVSTNGAMANASRHATRADAQFRTAAACNGCHQFDFPEPQKAPMQGTRDEHRISRFASSSCQTCHMPMVTSADGAKHHNHDFRVMGNAAMLQSALSVQAFRGTNDNIHVVLSAAHVGHAVPTGDMFRRLEVRARVLNEELEARPVVLARRFAMIPRANGHSGALRVQVGDDRVPSTGEAREVDLVFPESILEKDIAWEVAYQRMPAAMAAVWGVDATADEIIVAQGILPAKKESIEKE